MRLPALAVTLHLAQAAAPGDPRGDAPIWYALTDAIMADRFSRTDGATALYESMRRQATRPAGGS